MKGQRRIVAGTKAARQGMARNQRLLVHHDWKLSEEIRQHNAAVEQAKARKDVARRPGLDAITQRIRAANPTWTDRAVLAQAKAEWHKENAK